MTFLPCLGVVAVCSSSALAQNELHVGPGQRFTRPEEALRVAAAGDSILIHPRNRNAPYERVALRVTVPRLTIRAVPESEDEPVALSGEGFDFSGVGSAPRAIVQFDPGASGGRIEGFVLTGAHNASHNGAGVRINQADHVTVRGCIIRGNDMGIMSNGAGEAGAGQRIEGCLIEGNGAPAEPGFSHNLYLGGRSVVVSACEIRGSTAGHNVKSRAHYTRVEYCYIHDSANREVDLVDEAGQTDLPGSDAVLMGNTIVKARDMAGNRGVIHFGQDGGQGHDGTLWVVNNTIVTPHASPVVWLSSPGASLRLVNTIVWDGGVGQSHQVLAEVAGEPSQRLRGGANIVSGGFGAPAWAGVLDLGGWKVRLVDEASGDFRLLEQPTGIAGRGEPIASIGIPAAPGENGIGPFSQYQRGRRLSPRHDAPAPDLGAFMNNP